MRSLWAVDLPYAFFGIEVENEIIVEAAPIGRWMIGSSWPAIQKWVAQKGGALVPAGYAGEPPPEHASVSPSRNAG